MIDAKSLIKALNGVIHHHVGELTVLGNGLIMDFKTPGIPLLIFLCVNLLLLSSLMTVVVVK